MTHQFSGPEFEVVQHSHRSPIYYLFVSRSSMRLPVLDDRLVRLRPFLAEDAHALRDIWRDPEIRRRNEVPDDSEPLAQEWIAKSSSRAARGEAWEWAIVDLQTNTLAGRRALKEIDWKKGEAIAAAWVAPQFRGNRFASRSLRLAAGFAFSRGLNCIRAECEIDNEAALRSVLAAGMRPAGTLRGRAISIEGKEVDTDLFEMRPEDLGGM